MNGDIGSYIATYVPYIIVSVLLLIVTMILSFYIGRNRGQTIELRKQAEAQKTADDLRANARLTIENENKVARLEMKEKLRALEEEKTKEFTSIRDGLVKQENELRVAQKEITFREELIEKQQKEITQEMAALKQDRADFALFSAEESERLEQQLFELAKLSEKEAEKVVLDRTYKLVSKDIAQYIREQETKAAYKIKQKSKALLTQAMQKYSSEVATERTVSVVTLSSDELKGRLIGREGRNIRSIEMLTGVDVIIDDTPEAVVLSCFDPIRRELARMLVQTLVDDGRIHPGRIEEIYYQKTCELDQILIELGEQTLVEMNLPSLDSELLKLIGKLHYRTSYGQNILQHSKEVGFIAGILATELGEDGTLARQAGLLHDIGKAVDFEHEGTHIELGVKIAKKFGLNEIVTNAIASHHGDTDATSLISEFVAIADSLSAIRPGARRESFESYINRLNELEELSNSFDGVQKAYAIQAGREIRVLVNPDELTDDEIVVLSYDLKKQIEDKLQYPGTVKVTVIRETRAIDIAK